MKTIILFSLLALIILAAKSAPAPVLDAHGKVLRAGAKYRVKPAYSDGYNGGLILAHVGNKPCPLVVGQDLGLNKGLWLTFTPVNPKERVIRVSTDVNIKFSGSNSCNESNIWQLKYNEVLKERVVMVGGVEGNPGPETLYSWFKLENSTYSGYKFVFCPTVCSHCELTCGDLFPFLTDGSNGQPLALYNATSWPFSVIFY
ncbi:putative proteinase inhibitor I3, Kunitz legume, kunitz inhibitor STI-like superfamily [Helianthus annuus]|nr:putative proteinase inhibitor I3, Kunitz legume, kunitz inhibitor STI-like superfamily [Helianthus annuus]KAJ0564936.1 putative proteinase inhibitor I3, Kunitz legume, kunitz inhibitor STI-like superfamily [Helianthus annuus]KAJ0736465.1 putative proteinase inhibitor I3, Kunitz legume, kunitz inhibitor STI-like superfamily [Helianthus annuus]KAJ0736469.1 putative proteinase inhibitor I3, Kunitz legume, kunitz inhibitor STI-like superfamily [Helianthus annuus]